MIRWVLFALLLAATGCKSAATSEVKYGHLNYITPKLQKMINVGPKEKIAICLSVEDDMEVVKWALLIWAKPIRRDKIIEKNLVACDDPKATRKLEVRTAGGGSYAWVMPYELKVNYVASRVKTSETFFKSIMLHEFGHIWGLCDQYNLRACDPSYSSSASMRSIMGTTNETKLDLTDDDIEGMHSLAERKDLSHYEDWKKILGD